MSKNLYESLFIMHKCNLTIERLNKLVVNSALSSKEDQDFALLHTYYIILESVTFLDEFNLSFRNVESEYLVRVADVRKITAPIIKKINKWKDLEKFRNNIIAHPWRNKGKFIIPNQTQFNIPRNWLENQILVNLMAYLWSMIKAEFLVEYSSALKYISSLQSAPNPKDDYSTLNQEHLDMAENVRSVCKDLGKSYFLKVLLYDLPK